MLGLHPYSLVIFITASLLAGCDGGNSSNNANDKIVTEAEAAATEVLERHMAARNNIDPVAISEEDNYPQIRFSAGTVQRTESAEITIVIEERIVQPLLEESGWDHSEWDEIKIVQSSENKVHFALVFSRFDALGERYRTSPTFWVVTNQENHWGIKLRSSFVDDSGEGGDIAEAETAAIKILENYVEARNNRDSEGIGALASYPLVFLSDVELSVFETIDEYIVHEETVTVPELDYSEWDHSEWEKLEVIQNSGSMVHVKAKLSHFDVVGKKILTQDQLWFITGSDGDWKIQALSSFVDAIQRRT